MSKEFGNAPNPQSNLYASATSSQPAASDVPSLAPTALASQPSTQHSVSSVVPTSHKRRSRLGEEESNLSAETAARFRTRLERDHQLVTNPDVDAPFADQEDVVNRLLPYHVFQHPQEDLDAIVSTGKGQNSVSDLQAEIRDTKFALECYKRRADILDRWRRARIRTGKRASPDDQAYFLAQVVLESDRAENAWLNGELKTARSEADRLEREKRTATARVPATATTTSAVHATGYYRTYPYAYTQAYGSISSTPTMTTFQATPQSTTPSATTTTTNITNNYAPYQSGAIPVQLPVASLPALHALGIVPVPTTSLPTDGQNYPAAVLRGSSANGTVLNLEINVSLLQPTQMSGLAMVLNSLVSRNSSSTTTSQAPQAATPAKS